MDNTTTYNLSISELKEFFPSQQWISLDDDFCMLNIRQDDHLHAITHPCRFDGIIFLYCVTGHVKLSVNLNEYDIRDRHLILCSPGNIVKVTDVVDGQGRNFNYVVLAMSRQFAADLRLDYNKVMNEGMAILETPVITISDKGEELMAQYLGLMAKVVGSEVRFRDDALRSLVTSMISVIAGFWIDRVDEMKVEASRSTSRSRMVFEQFIRLVSEHHTRYRNVGFYADKLCLTPKYLSKLIKTASGKSAPEWIDAYVILEAKNLLKYSNVTIKEIVYRLNIPNQSVFYKFFKARTGMTPSEYRSS